MDSIISYYFTTAKDPQGREPIKKNDPNYIKKWYDSVVSLGLQCVLFHDGFTQEFIDEFPKMRFIQVPPVPKGMQLHDYHWAVSHNYLLRHDEIENVFFTDCPDVVVVKNPFEEPEYKQGVLYCGDEPQKINESDFMRAALYNESLNKLPEFINILASNKILYNGGVLGGSRDKVLEFTTLISELIEKVKFRRVDGTGDMALYNYILHRHFHPVHGEPVNSVFKKYEDRKDVWFIHK